MKNQISLYQGSFKSEAEAKQWANKTHSGKEFEIEILKSQGKEYYNLMVKFNIG